MGERSVLLVREYNSGFSQKRHLVFVFQTAAENCHLCTFATILFLNTNFLSKSVNHKIGGGEWMTVKDKHKVS